RVDEHDDRGPARCEPVSHLALERVGHADVAPPRGEPGGAAGDERAHDRKSEKRTGEEAPRRTPARGVLRRHLARLADAHLSVLTPDDGADVADVELLARYGLAHVDDAIPRFVLALEDRHDERVQRSVVSDLAQGEREDDLADPADQG